MSPVDWNAIDLVVFDLDGTLYDQRQMRARMAVELAASALRTRDLRTLRILRSYRRCRERLAETTPSDFFERQFADTAMSCGCSTEEVKAIVAEWMDDRPLRHLRACRRSGVEELFEGLRRSGKTITVLSDYPAKRKIEALELKADIVVGSCDPDVRRLKPDPAGLRKILRETGTEPHRSLMVGDRFDRDWAVADKVGMNAVILSRRKDARCRTFHSYDAAMFAAGLYHRPAHAMNLGRARFSTDGCTPHAPQL